MQQQTLSLRFRTEQFRLHAATLGLTTETQIADAAGLDRSTVNRLFNGNSAPGERAIAAILVAFPDRKFEDFFEVAVPRVRVRAA